MWRKRTAKVLLFLSCSSIRLSNSFLFANSALCAWKQKLLSRHIPEVGKSKGTAYHSPKQAFAVPVLHSSPPNICSARGWTGKGLPGSERRAFSDKGGPLHKFGLTRLSLEQTIPGEMKKSRVDRSVNMRSVVVAERSYQISSFSSWFSDWVGSM